VYVRFEPADDGNGVVAVDDIERRRLTFRTLEPVDLRDADPGAFRVPVSVACAFETEYLALDHYDVVFVRDGSGIVGRVSAHEEFEVGPGSHTIELNLPIKLYLAVEGPLTIEAGADYLRFRFDDRSPVRIGARSFHERPAATITTTDDPEDVMTAVSHLRSALKTTSCERSYPTLRGHPPAIELGSELDVPESVADRCPETGIRIFVPPEYAYVYPVAPLAFYLGAQVTPGSPPRLTTREGFEYRLTEDGPFEDVIAGVLRQVLFLDCVVRTEGIYRVNLYERTEVEERLPFDPATLYDYPLGGQLSRYLEVPFAELEPFLQRWGMTAHLPNRPASAEALPFVLDQLGIVRGPRGRRVASPEGGGGEASGPRLDSSSRRRYVVPDRTGESAEHAWFADALPLGATKSMVRAYRNRLRREEPEGPLRLVVVCNDQRMAQETGTLDTVYGSRGEFPYLIDSHTELGVDAFRDVLTSEAEFVHYIGDSDGGLECPDGRLDTNSLSEVSVETFLLNAPGSARQAMGLIRAGAIGGVATLSDVARDDAVTIGRGLARLLNLGFPLTPAIDIVQQHAHSGDRYLVVGDGTVDIAQSSGPPAVCDITSRDDGDYELSVEFHPKEHDSMIGAFGNPTLPGAEESFLLPGRLGRTFTLSREELLSYVRSHSYPIRVDGELRWNDDIRVEEFH